MSPDHWICYEQATAARRRDALPRRRWHAWVAAEGRSLCGFVRAGRMTGQVVQIEAARPAAGCCALCLGLAVRGLGPGPRVVVAREQAAELAAELGTMADATRLRVDADRAHGALFSWEVEGTPGAWARWVAARGQLLGHAAWMRRGQAHLQRGG